MLGREKRREKAKKVCEKLTDKGKEIKKRRNSIKEIFAIFFGFIFI
jgi:hypothetical protein